MNNKPVSRKKDIVIQELNGEVLVYDLRDNKAFCLNETSALVWQMCDGNNSVSEISKNLSKKLKSVVSEDYVWLAIDQLKDENLIANAEELRSSFEAMNRRDVIKKVGLASMIALPFVAGMVAPTSAMAVSAGLPNQSAVGSASTTGNVCGNNGGGGPSRNAVCQANYGSGSPNDVCNSGNSASTPGTCTYDNGTNTSTFNCRCIA